MSKSANMKNSLECTSVKVLPGDKVQGEGDEAESWGEAGHWGSCLGTWT